MYVQVKGNMSIYETNAKTDAIKSDRERGLKYSQVLPDIYLIVSAPYNESINVV